MKRDMNDLNLRKAFAPMPDACRSALMDAARSVKEETPVKRAPLRTALIAALILAATAAVAYAASRLLGWTDYYARQYDVSVPKAAMDTLAATEPAAYEVGPMTLTFDQLLCDGHIAMSAANAHMTDGSEALYAPSSDYYEAVGMLSDVIPQRYGINRETTWLEAAQQLGLPLYGVRALIEVDPSLSGESMEDALWNEDGSIVYFNMALLHMDDAQSDLPVTLFMRVAHIDPKTGEELDLWKRREEATIPLSPMLSQREYAPQGDATLGDLTLLGVRAEQYVTGWYLYASLRVPEGMDEDDIREVLFGLSICDESGQPLPYGLSLSGGADLSALPVAVLEEMTSLETLPDTLAVTDGERMVVVR